jgi:hypothetical protein
MWAGYHGAMAYPISGVRYHRSHDWRTAANGITNFEHKRVPGSVPGRVPGSTDEQIRHLRVPRVHRVLFLEFKNKKGCAVAPGMLASPANTAPR